MLESVHIKATPLDFEQVSTLLWDSFEAVSERCRHSKQTAKIIGAACEERAALEERYAKDLLKISRNNEIPEIVQTSLWDSWASLKKTWEKEALLHLELSKSLILQTADPLNDIRLELKRVKEVADANIENTSKAVEESVVALSKAEQRLKEVTSNFKVKDRLQKISEFSELVEQAQAANYQALNRHYQTVASGLQTIAKFELKRIEDTASILVNLFNQEWHVVTGMTKELNRMYLL